jgi:plastocyanin
VLHKEKIIMRTAIRQRITVFVILGLVLDLVGAVMPHAVHAQTMQITIAKFSFRPATLTIPVGTTVTWTNQDSVTHTSTSDTGVWNSGNLTHGQSFSFTFKKPGKFSYHCAVHPFMKASITVQAAAAATSSPTATHPNNLMMALHMGLGLSSRQTAWLGYYDGHKDTYLSTDVSNKGQAMAMHINFAPALRRTPMGATPPIYLVKGRSTGNQLAVFGSQPGETDYSPLWREIIVQWKPNVKPVLLKQDNQILKLAKKGKLTLRHTNIVLNCPIIKVGK